MTLFDDIVRWLGLSASSEEGSFFGSIFESFWTIIFFVLIGIGVLVAWRTVRYVTAYAGSGEQLDSWKFDIQGKSMVKGNLSKNTTAIDDGSLRTILMASEFYKEDLMKKGFEHYQKEYKNGNLFIYDFRPRDWEDAWDLNAKDSIVISAVDLQDKDYSWLEPKGDWNIMSPTFRLKSRKVQCFSESEYIEDLEDPYGDEFDAYNLIPMPTKLEGKIKTVGGGLTAIMQLKKIEFGKEIALLSQYVPTLSETYEKIVPAEKEVIRLRKMINDKDIEISDTFREVEDQRHIAYPRPLLGWGNPQSLPSKSELAVWIVISLIAGGFSYAMPDLVPSLERSVSPWLTFFGGFIIVFALYSYIQSKKKETMSKTEREEKAF